MKQILPKLNQLEKHLSFTKKAFSKGGFRHVTQYINGLVTLNKKTIKRISEASLPESHHSAINRVLSGARFDQEYLEMRYLKKIKYLTKGQRICLLFDDTLIHREGKHIEDLQYHYDHSSGKKVSSHQFFTSIIHTPLLQLPMFPRLYSCNTDSKIQMAYDIVDKIIMVLPLYCVMFDSWYSDKKLINKCRTKGVKVICGIKTNRKICFKKGQWKNLGNFSKNVNHKKFKNYFIDEVKYQIAEYKPKLNAISPVKMLISKEYNEDKKEFKDHFHLISTNLNDTPVQIIREYRIRWVIETYHRDIKQNLGFSKVFLRKKEAIVSHAIFVTLAYIILKLYMFFRGMNHSIGQCIAHIQDREMDDFIREIILIEDKKERLNMFEEVFIRKTAKL